MAPEASKPILGDPPAEVAAAIDAFHGHLDVCKQCSDHPFDLCQIGRVRILKAGVEATEWLATEWLATKSPLSPTKGDPNAQ